MIKGILIGICMVLPGISGAIIAVILGVYDKTMNLLTNIFKIKLVDFLFLLKLSLGIIIGAMISANTLKLLFSKYYLESSYMFIGFIIGCVPYLLKKAKKNNGFKINYFAIIISLSVPILFLNRNYIYTSFNNITYVKLILLGFLFIAGKIIPGLSSTSILMMINMYEYFLDMISNIPFFILNHTIEFIFILLGVIIGFIVFTKLINYSLEKYYSLTYSLIIGFVINSVFYIIPKDINIYGILIAISGFIIAYIVSNNEFNNGS